MNLLKTFFYSLKKSLFEPKYYKDITKTNFWFSFKYLWFLVFILTFIKSLTFTGSYLKNRPQIQPGINRFMNDAQTFYPRNLEIKIRNGQLSTNVKEPYIFDVEKNEWKKNDRHLLIIDTKGSIENYPNYNTYILATKNAVVYPSKSRNDQIEQTSVFYFRDLKHDFTLNKNVYDNLLNIVRPYTLRALFFVDSIGLSFLFLFLIFGSLFWTGGITFGLLFLTFFVWIVNLIFKKQYVYCSLYKMGMHAATWPILISEVVRYTKLPLPSLYAMVFLVWMLVILFSSKETKTKPTKRL